MFSIRYYSDIDVDSEFISNQMTSTKFEIGEFYKNTITTDLIHNIVLSTDCLDFIVEMMEDSEKIYDFENEMCFYDGNPQHVFNEDLQSIIYDNIDQINNIINGEKWMSKREQEEDKSEQEDN